MEIFRSLFFFALFGAETHPGEPVPLKKKITGYILKPSLNFESSVFTLIDTMPPKRNAARTRSLRNAEIPLPKRIWDILARALDAAEGGVTPHVETLKKARARLFEAMGVGRFPQAEKFHEIIAQLDPSTLNDPAMMMSAHISEQISMRHLHILRMMIDVVIALNRSPFDELQSGRQDADALGDAEIERYKEVRTAVTDEIKTIGKDIPINPFGGMSPFGMGSPGLGLPGMDPLGLSGAMWPIAGGGEFGWMDGMGLSPMGSGKSTLPKDARELIIIAMQLKERILHYCTEFEVHKDLMTKAVQRFAQGLVMGAIPHQREMLKAYREAVQPPEMFREQYGFLMSDSLQSLMHARFLVVFQSVVVSASQSFYMSGMMPGLMMMMSDDLNSVDFKPLLDLLRDKIATLSKSAQTQMSDVFQNNPMLMMNMGGVGMWGGLGMGMWGM